MSALLLSLALCAHADEPAATEAVERPAATVIQVPSPAPAEPDVVRGRVVLVPGVGYRARGDATVDGLSLGLALSRAEELRGVDLSAGANWVDGDLTGVQASGFASVAWGEVKGVQASGFVAAAGSADVQASGFLNYADEHVGVAQLTGGANVLRGGFEGLQASGFANIAVEESTGAQLSGGANFAGELEGVQAAPLNVARELKGAQVGLLNVGGEVKGTQVGLVNIAKSVEGESIGLLSFVGNGIHRFDVWASDTSTATLDFKLGSKSIYTIAGIGYVRPGETWWTTGLGMGGHVPVGPGWVEIDGMGWMVAEGNAIAPGVLSKVRLSAGLQLAKHIAPFAGVSANVWTGTGTVVPRAIGLPDARNEEGTVVMWPGIHAGVQF